MSGVVGGRNLRPLDRLIRTFTWMAGIGTMIVLLGTGVGLTLTGAASAGVISASLGFGGMMIFAGLRGRIKGNRTLSELRRHPT